MPPSTPFIDRESGTLDTVQIRYEAVPLAKLVALVAAVALVPRWIATEIGLFPGVFALLAQFVVAVGSSVVLLYVIARGIQLAEE